MTMPMIIIEIFVMSSMYMDKNRNALISAGSAVALVAFSFFIRQQTAVSDRQFLKSMIPGDPDAEQANLRDPELKKLGKKIIADQRAEIAQMKAKLKELDD